MAIGGKAFGRKVRLTIYAKDIDTETNAYVFESDVFGGERGLKISGTINKYFALQPADATIDIYNLNPIEMANILALRVKKVDNKIVERPLRIKVEAGYINSLFGVIFDGEILKPNMVRPDPNNTILRLTCLNAIGFISAGSLLTQTFNEGINYYEVAKQVAKNNGIGLNVYVSEELKKYKVDGSFVTKDTIDETYKSIVNDVGENFFVNYDNDNITIKTWDDVLHNKSEAIVLNSQTGLIGFPSLTTDGVTVQSILNPNLDILKLIKLDNSTISINQPNYLAERELGAWLSSDGLYGVVKISHQFDTTTGVFSSTCVCLARDYYKYILTE